MALSVLYRNSQKYFDHVLEGKEIGSGQLLCLFYIYENEGCILSEVSKVTEFDKGTTTKNIQKLASTGYIEIKSDEEDKRLKRMYVSEKGNALVNKLYIERSSFQSQVFDGIDFQAFEETLQKACDNSRSLFPREEEEVKIGGLQKLTLLDYPGKTACIVFTSGCNFKCPYCHNKELVFVPDYYDYVKEEDVFSFLQKRQGKLDGVVITGGEPLIQEGLVALLTRIKAMGYAIKLDTNGLLYEKLEEIVSKGLVDYVAMDVKNVKEKYGNTIGLSQNAISYDNIEKAIQILQTYPIEHEFRITIVKDFHTEDDILQIVNKLKVSNIYLQQFQQTPTNIQQNLTPYANEELLNILKKARTINPTTYLRGIQEVRSCTK